MKRTCVHHGLLPLPFLVFVISFCLLATVCVKQTASAETAISPLLKGLSRDEVLLLGEAMYQQSKLPSGELVQAVVKGDIRVDGGMFTCTSCHLRSGFGVVEGLVRTPPIDGTRLYSPLSKFKGIPQRGSPGVAVVDDVYRPAYTDETLAAVIRTGIDPTGKKINDVMPLYLLNDRDAAIMVYYLKTLSTGTQPGVTDATLRFATVITDEVSPQDRDAMLVPLQAFIRNWRVSRSMDRMARAESYVMEGAPRALRSLSLAVWDLKGPAETWRSQLEDHYRKEPVFALLAGMSTRDWTPIHRFCEDNKIPAIFPITDLPALSDTDWYTLYLSKGLSQEGEAAARYLHAQSDLAGDLTYVQIYRKDRYGLALSRAFQEAWQALGHRAPVNIALEENAEADASLWNQTIDKRDHTVVLLWLNASVPSMLGELAKNVSRPMMIFISSTLLGHRLYSLPDAARSSVYITYPYTLPQVVQQRQPAAASPSQGSTAPSPVPDIKSKMQHVFSAISGPLSRLRSYVYREYFLELLETTPERIPIQAAYPRLSYGPGQRYASKGCYIVQLSEGPDPKLLKKSDWVIH